MFSSQRNLLYLLSGDCVVSYRSYSWLFVGRHCRCQAMIISGDSPRALVMHDVRISIAWTQNLYRENLVLQRYVNHHLTEITAVWQLFCMVQRFSRRIRCLCYDESEETIQFSIGQMMVQAFVYGIRQKIYQFSCWQRLQRVRQSTLLLSV